MYCSLLSGSAVLYSSVVVGAAGQGGKQVVVGLGGLEGKK